MIKKEAEKLIVVKMRREGKTYSQILSVVPVAKSTVGLWLKEVNLSRPQKQKLTEAKLLSSKRGGEAKRKQRIEKQNFIGSMAKMEICELSQRDLFLIGVSLYWAEGSKEKEYRPGSRFQFSNMDPKMITVFLEWLFRVCKVDKNMLIFSIFLHKSHKNRLEEVKLYWSSITGFPVKSFDKIYFKKNKLKKTNRKNTGEKYYGVLRVSVRSSSDLVRKTAGWADGIFEKIANR